MATDDAVSTDPTSTEETKPRRQFGAKLRIRFTCVVEDVGDQWQLRSLTGLT